MNKQHDNANEFFYPLKKQELLDLQKMGYLSNYALVYLAIKIEGYLSATPPKTTVENFSANWGIPKPSVYKAIAKLKKDGLLPDWIDYNPKEVNSVESKVRDNLQAQLGGLTEVTTLSGRIDLLTDTEIIEVKNIKDWKAALGQILVYSAFYPDHKKRIHLFGENIDNLADLELSCLPFDVAVTGELI